MSWLLLALLQAMHGLGWSQSQASPATSTMLYYAQQECARAMPYLPPAQVCIMHSACIIRWLSLVCCLTRKTWRSSGLTQPPPLQMDLLFLVCQQSGARSSQPSLCTPAAGTGSACRLAAWCEAASQRHKLRTVSPSVLVSSVMRKGSSLSAQCAAAQQWFTGALSAEQHAPPLRYSTV